MKLPRTIVEMAFPNNAELAKVKGESVHVVFMSERTFKTYEQNNTFHALLNCYWSSGVSSFISYDDMRTHYKRIAGLVVIKRRVILPVEVKKLIYLAIEKVRMSAESKSIVYKLLKGESEQELSWAEATKDQAITAIEAIKKDMLLSNIHDSPQAAKFEQILNGMERF